MEKQQTLRQSAVLSGIALHTGARATLKILPAPENHGIVFRRVDIAGKPEVRALASSVVDVRRGTTIGDGKAVVHTIEHIMSALHAHQIDNATVEMDGEEPPIVDGSSGPFFQMIAEAGIAGQEAEAKYFTPDRVLFVGDAVTRVVIAPSDKLTVACVTSFAGCPYDPQFLDIEVTAESYGRELSTSRTFVNYRDIRQLSAMGLVKGGSLDAASIIHDGAIICKDGLRFTNEIVRHKIMDLVGDIYLCGRRVRGNIVAVKPGHPKNVELAGVMQKIICESN